MASHRNTLLPILLVVTIGLIGAGAELAHAAGPPALDQATIDKLMGKADQTEPPPPAEEAPGESPPTVPHPTAPPASTASPSTAPPQAISTSPAPLESAGPPARLGDALWELVQSSEPLTLRVNQSQHRVGERLELTVDIPKAGYLNILGVGPDDQPKVLYPNKYIPDNRVEPGPMRFPPAHMPGAFLAQEPVGVTRLFALLSAQPLNLYTEYQKGGDAALAAVFEPYVGGQEKAVGRALFHGAWLELQVCPARGPCP